MGNLVSAKAMVDAAKKGGYAVAHINTNNLEWTKAILTTCQETKTPVIIGVSEGAGKYFGGFEVVASLTKAMMHSMNITVPVALHLDHGGYEAALKCIEAGFSSIMFDGSHLPIEENIAKTKEIIRICHEKGISVESEVGTIGGEEDGVIGSGELADVNQCVSIAKLGPDMLAAGIGNIHGAYPPNWKGLDFELLSRVEKAVHPMPLVLHGGSGIPDDQVKRAITMGVAKINVNSELQWAFAKATVEFCLAGKAVGKGQDPRKMLDPGYQAIKKVIAEKCTLFGSLGKA